MSVLHTKKSESEIASTFYKELASDTINDIQ